MKIKVVKVLSVVLLLLVLFPVNSYALTIMDTDSATEITEDSNVLKRSYDNEVTLFDNNVEIKYSYDENCKNIKGYIKYVDIGDKITIKEINYSRPVLSYLPTCKEVYIKLGNNIGKSIVGSTIHFKIDYSRKKLLLYANYSQPNFPYYPYDTVVQNLYSWE